MSKVQILLSTYNGEEYIREQLNSILKQDYADISILIRDDGSTDNTLGIIKEYESKYNNVKYYNGENIGVINSFFDLMKNADISCDYFALSDQDDVWQEHKISRAVDILSKFNNDIPLLYCSNTTPVDSNLNELKISIKPYRIRPNFGNAVVENICTGCTCVFNRRLLLLVQEHIPAFTIMHDWWLYLLASAYGKVYYDNSSYLYYRQHSGNVVGTKLGYYDEFKKRVRNYRKNRMKISRQAAEFLKNCELDQANKKSLEYIVNAKSNLSYRFKIIFNNTIYRQRHMDNLIFKFLFLLGKV